MSKREHFESQLTAARNQRTFLQQKLAELNALIDELEAALIDYDRQ